MRTMKLDTGETLSLDAEGTWQGPEPLTALLNSLSELKMLNLSPADGDPVAVLFEYGIELLQPVAVINEAVVTDPGAVY